MAIRVLASRQPVWCGLDSPVAPGCLQIEAKAPARQDPAASQTPVLPLSARRLEELAGGSGWSWLYFRWLSELKSIVDQRHPWGNTDLAGSGWRNPCPGGDCCSIGQEREVQKFAKWLRTLPHPRKVVVAGNHAPFLEKYPSQARCAST